MSETLILLALVLLIALVSVAGGLLALLKQQVVVDKDGKPSEINLPWFGKIKTNYPSLFAIALGIVLAAFVTTKLSVNVKVDAIPLVATIETDGLPPGTYVTVAAFPQRYLLSTNQTRSDGTATVQFTVDEPGVPYSVVATSPIGFEDGRPVFAMAQGQATPDAAGRQLVFSGRLSQGGQDGGQP